jgi:hypothetical protein
VTVSTFQNTQSPVVSRKTDRPDRFFLFNTFET